MRSSPSRLALAAVLSAEAASLQPSEAAGGRALRSKGMSATLRRMAMGSQRRTELLRGVLDLCLLAVMDEGPAYGYEMTKRLRDRGLAIVGEGSIYPLLGRLERDGLVETYRAASNGGPPRKYYRPRAPGGWHLRWGCPNGELPAMPSMRCSLRQGRGGVDE